MGSAQDEFLAWLRQAFSEGEHLIRSELSRPPRWYFEQSTDQYVRSFYLKIDKWRGWISSLVSGLRRRLRHADHTVRAVEDRLSPEHFLRFRLETWNVSGHTVGKVDLSDRTRYSSSNGWVDLLLKLQRTRLEPDWNVVVQTLLDAVRDLQANIERQLPELALVAEPSNPKLGAAVERLAKRAYVNASVVRSEVLTAESNAAQRLWRDAASALRRAIEQLIEDAYAETSRRTGTPPSAAATCEAKATFIGRGFVDRATSRQAYASYSLLSNLGSHTGAPLADDEGESGWQSGVLAITLMARNLP